jgi:hypothetical protein
LLCWWLTLASSGRRHVREAWELRAKRTQLEMQLVVARVAAAAAVAIGASARTSLEAACQSANDRAATTETAAAAATTERDSLASRLALAKAEVEKLRVAATSVGKLPREPRPLGRNRERRPGRRPCRCSREGGA